ncbi:hypothetical protein RJ640_015052 [Escallonia rubra]|uniref:TCP domain-containing protein n=1 Tax=Escallonia rubra TaxID=112253 RepID=A0AA88UG52_9ASTE|nr:hypothetical protein RJ640_015052 [Escallonia rubra]
MKFPPNLNDERGKMTTSSKENNFHAKQEGEINNSKISKTTSNSRQWAGFKNPRIVRVSRTFGGKDRHSKVCTIKGLRDRRIRLSVPTAIQLYDLQDRLGLSQPSKVVDWLLDASKNDVDKLPPLQMPPGDFTQFYQPTLIPQESNAPQSSVSPFFNAGAAFNMKDVGTRPLLYSKQGIRINDRVDGNDQAMVGKAKDWASDDAAFREKHKEVERESSTNIAENNKWVATDERETQDRDGNYMPQLSAQNFFPLTNQSSFPSFLNSTMPYNYYQWEPSNLSLSQFGSQGFPSHADPSNIPSIPLPSSLALPSASPLFFPPYMSTLVDGDQRQVNQLQFWSSSSQQTLPNSLITPLHLIGYPTKSFQLNLNPESHSRNDDDIDKGGSGL